MTQLIHKAQQIKTLRNTDLAQASIGFVPTMGALHEGHLSLIRSSRKDNDITIVSIFVNPTQFDDPSDLSAYPKPVEKDLSLLKQEGVDYLFMPQYDELYPDNYRYKINENELSRRFCGAHRPGHFDGVLSVVMKLFNIVDPHRAYFGEKDYQQLELIQGMVEAFFMKVEIVPCPIVREKDGLALSSRNLRLSESERKQAPQFHEALTSTDSTEEAIELLKTHGFDVDYVEDLKNRRLAAIRLGEVRLIDNVPL